MSDEALIARLRELGDHASFEPHMHHKAADCIEALIAEKEQYWHIFVFWRAEADKLTEQLKISEAKLSKTEGLLAENEVRLRKAVKALNNAAIQLDWCQTAREISREIDATLAEIKSHSDEFVKQKGESQ